VDFVFDSEGTNPQQASLPPIELQPPLPPRTIAQVAVEPTTMTVATPKGNIKEPTMAASCVCFIDVRHAHVITWNTLTYISLVLSSPLLVSALVPPSTPQWLGSLR